MIAIARDFEQEFLDSYDHESNFPLTNQQLRQIFSEYLCKYEALTSFSRKHFPADLKYPMVKQNYHHCLGEYNDEVQTLRGNRSNYYAGMYAGMMASFRLALDLALITGSNDVLFINEQGNNETPPVAETLEFALREFPFLDT
jgi:hypothetical protein